MYNAKKQLYFLPALLLSIFAISASAQENTLAEPHSKDSNSFAQSQACPYYFRADIGYSWPSSKASALHVNKHDEAGMGSIGI